VLVRFTKGLVLSALGCAVSASVFAADADHKMGFEYRAGLNYNNNGLTKREGYTPKATSELSLDAANFYSQGMAAKDVDYRFRVNLLGVNERGEMSLVEYGYVNLKMGMLSVLVGRNKTHQGGFEVRDFGYDTLHASDYLGVLPFRLYEDMAQVSMEVAGTLSLQLVNDVQAKTTAAGGSGYQTVYHNTAARQPAMIVEWIGNFGGFSPLVQIGSFDLNHDKFFSLGLQGAVAIAKFGLDYTMDNRQYDVGDKKLTDTLTNVNLDVAIAAGIVDPFLKISMYNNKQAADSSLGKEDAKANTFSATGGDFDDNGTRMTVGVVCNAISAGYRPYFSLSNHSGTFAKAATGTEKESRADMEIAVGVHGKF